MADFQLNSKKTGSLALGVIIGLAGSALGWALAALTIMKAGGQPLGWWPEAWRYYDTNLPMISSADGFFFMHQAQVAMDNGFANIPPFSKLTAVVSMIFSKPVEWTAFYISLFFHLALGLLAVSWGRMLNAGKFCTFLACAAIALMPAWLERGGPGRFDTDLPIVLFWQLGLFFLVKAQRALKVTVSLSVFVYFASGIVSFAVLAWIWTAGAGLALASVGLWFFIFMPRRIWSYKARAIVGALAVIWLAMIFILPSDKAPIPKVAFDWIHSHFTLAFGGRSELFYSSIKELYPLSFYQLLEKVGGGIPGGVAVIMAGILALIAFPAFRLPLLLSFVCILAGIKSNRMVYLGSFPLALSLGFLPYALAELTSRSRMKLNRLIIYSAGAICSLAVIAGCFYWGTKRDIDLRWERAHDRLVETLRQEGTEADQAKLWNWWDDGYFLAARTKDMKPLFDGGSQTHIMAYIAARPFIMEDRRAAARWMRFFAIRGQAGINPLIKEWGEDEAWNKLEMILSAETPEEVAADIAKIPGGSDWFFPAGKVYWYMPDNFLKISNWWIPLGLSRTPDKNLVKPHIEKTGRDKFLYDSKNKSLTITQDLWDRGYKNFGLVFNTSQNPLSPPWPMGGAPYIVYSEKNITAYITDQFGIRSLPLYMMVPGGETPASFRPMAVDYEWGGVWEILM